MHMADALVSPVVGLSLWAASGTLLGWSSRQVRQADQERLVPLMGVLGAFIFAAQMLNFSIPATGSSGHIGGGLLLAILLGPHPAFVVIASVLTVQALFFADGGLLALGANIFNLGALPCFIGYLLIYRPLIGANPLAHTPRRVGWAAMLAAIVGLQLGALGVVVETLLSGITSLPASAFLLLMQPIHLAIGLIEGLATAVVVLFIRRARPDLFSPGESSHAVRTAAAPLSLRPLLLALGAAAALSAGVFSWFASTQPDGLEWSIEQVSGSATPPTPASEIHATLTEAQKKIAWLADYKFPFAAPNQVAAPAERSAPKPGESGAETIWPAVDANGSLAGLIGAAATLSLVMSLGYLLQRRRGSP